MLKRLIEIMVIIALVIFSDYLNKETGVKVITTAEILFLSILIILGIEYLTKALTLVNENKKAKQKRKNIKVSKKDK